jgi:hypothetical protein
MRSGIERILTDSGALRGKSFTSFINFSGSTCKPSLNLVIPGFGFSHGSVALIPVEISGFSHIFGFEPLS